MNKKERIKLIKSIIKRVDKMTAFTIQLKKSIDAAPTVKHYNKSKNQWIAYKKIKTDAR